MLGATLFITFPNFFSLRRHQYIFARLSNFPPKFPPNSLLIEF
ncbi:hypothetical protein CAEBREN_18280 [Caenorhabditis brenneri]|uniref:Uncharacterized protein n=1 Tax=Caenorhabditis brenneri TaxID=135651 RepID=G0P1V0_CAEBE|nr:hypothetical protein CAEBREN_18280 [Caenorhabditis brenneri]